MIPLLKAEEVAARFAVRRETVYRMVNQGLLPKPVKISTTTARWPEPEIAAVTAARIAGKNNDQIRHLVQNLTRARQAADSPPTAA